MLEALSSNATTDPEVGDAGILANHGPADLIVELDDQSSVLLPLMIRHHELKEKFAGRGTTGTGVDIHDPGDLSRPDQDERGARRAPTSTRWKREGPRMGPERLDEKRRTPRGKRRIILSSRSRVALAEQLVDAAEKRALSQLRAGAEALGGLDRTHAGVVRGRRPSAGSR